MGRSLRRRCLRPARPAPRTCRTVRASPGAARRRRRPIRAASPQHPGSQCRSRASRSRSWGSSLSSGRARRTRRRTTGSPRPAPTPTRARRPPRSRPCRRPSTSPQPGTTINLAAGTYREAVATKTAGTATAPITIKGPETGKDVNGRYKAVLYGLGGRVFSINHSYYTLSGFTIDGQTEHRPHRVPRRLLAVADPDVQGLGAGQGRQQQADLRRGVHHAAATSSARRSRTCSSTAPAASACGSATAPRTA